MEVRVLGLWEWGDVGTTDFISTIGSLLSLAGIEDYNHQWKAEKQELVLPLIAVSISHGVRTLTNGILKCCGAACEGIDNICFISFRK